MLAQKTDVNDSIALIAMCLISANNDLDRLEEAIEGNYQALGLIITTQIQHSIHSESTESYVLTSGLPSLVSR